MPLETNYSAPPQSTTAGQEETSPVGNPGGSIQDAMDASRTKLSSAYATVQHRSTEAMESAEHFIQERPWQAIIYAASIGAVIGLVAGIVLSAERQPSAWYRRFW